MTPYEVIIPSASRPALLDRVLTTLLVAVDQPPQMVRVHDDAAFPGRQGDISNVVQAAGVRFQVPTMLVLQDPPIFHGPALWKLLQAVHTEYVLYSQDDHEVVRPLPIVAALAVMVACPDVHQIRFNKRTTMTPKDKPFKREVQRAGQTLVTSGHWHFQTSLWRVSRIYPIVEWWVEFGSSFREHCEAKVNFLMNGQIPEFSYAHPEVPVWPDPATSNTAEAREALGTFIWGRIGEPAYVTHLGGDREHWALPRVREGSGGYREHFPPESSER